MAGPMGNVGSFRERRAQPVHQQTLALDHNVMSRDLYVEHLIVACGRRPI
jgi:hypothetical protein